METPPSNIQARNMPSFPNYRHEMFSRSFNEKNGYHKSDYYKSNLKKCFLYNNKKTKF